MFFAGTPEWSAEETHTFDPTEEVYGDLCIIQVNDEEADKKFIDCFAIIQPAVDIRDVPSLKASLVGSNKVEIVTVGTRHTFKSSSNAWLKVLDTMSTKISAKKLYLSLKSTMTTLKKTKHYKKITVTFLNEELSNEYLNPGAAEGQLSLVAIPYVYEHETTSKKTGKKSQFKNTEVCVLWRAFIVDSERPMGEESDSDLDEDIMEAMGDLLGEQS